MPKKIARFQKKAKAAPTRKRTILVRDRGKNSQSHVEATSATFTWTDLWHVLLAIFVSQLAGIIGSFFTISEIANWYAYLNKPFFTPPNWLFGPVWTLLYTLMGIALFLSCRYGKPATTATRASYWFYAQLVVNVLWSVVYFGLHSLWGGLIGAVVLWLLIFKTIQMFSLVNRTAAWLMMPYILWVSYAAFLNLSLAILN